MYLFFHTLILLAAFKQFKTSDSKLLIKKKVKILSFSYPSTVFSYKTKNDQLELNCFMQICTR